MQINETDRIVEDMFDITLDLGSMGKYVDGVITLTDVKDGIGMVVRFKDLRALVNMALRGTKVLGTNRVGDLKLTLQDKARRLKVMEGTVGEGTYGGGGRTTDPILQAIKGFWRDKARKAMKADGQKDIDAKAIDIWITVCKEGMKDLETLEALETKVLAWAEGKVKRDREAQAEADLLLDL